MSKTIAYISMTLDGFVAGKDDDLSWLTPYASVDYGYQEFYKDVGAIILGLRTYEHILKHWDWPYGNIPAFVLSDDPLSKVPDNAEVQTVHGSLTEALAQAKNKTDNNIWIGGGAHVVQEFLNAHLTDELIITIVPVFIGEGIRLFEHMSPDIKLAHYYTKDYEKGMVQIGYRIVRA